MQFFLIGEAEVKDEKVLVLLCSNIECRRIGKKGCFRKLCKRCCNKTESNELENNDNCSDLDKNSQSNINKSNVHVCTVHKSSAKEIEKMKIKKKELEFKKYLQNKKINTDSNMNSDVEYEILQKSDQSVELSGKITEIIVENKSDELDIENTKEENISNRNDLNKIKFKGGVNENYLEPHGCQKKEIDSAVKDGSISCVINAAVEVPYKSTCRALLIGIGADEQMVMIINMILICISL